MRCKSKIQAVGNYTRQIIICSTDALAKKTKKCQTAFRLKENRLVRGRGWAVIASFTKTESISRRGGSEAVSLVSETLLEMRVD